MFRRWKRGAKGPGPEPGEVYSGLRRIAPRELTSNEIALLRRIAGRLDDDNAGRMLAQVDAARVVGGLPTALDLAVRSGAQAMTIADGPLPGRAFVTCMRGEVLVWVCDGMLSELEYAWTCDDPPDGMPSASDVYFEP